VTCLVSRHQHPACFMGLMLPHLRRRDSYLLHRAQHHSIKVTSLVTAVSAWDRHLQHLCPHHRPSHLSASLLPRIPLLAIAAINSHRYPSRRIIRTFLSIPSTAITTTAISFLTPLNNSNNPRMPCRCSHRTVLRGRNAAYVCSSLYIYEHTFPPFFPSFFLVSVFTHLHTDCSFVSIYLSLATMLPSNCLSSPHTLLEPVHFTALSYRSTPSPLLRFILIYTSSFVISTLTHIVSAPTPSLCLRTSCIPCCCSFSLVSPSSGTICFCTGPVFYRYLRNLFDAYWMRNHQCARTAEHRANYKDTC